MIGTTQIPYPEAFPARTPGARYGGIAVGVDGSASAVSAALWAAGEAHRRGVPLTIVHAVHLPDPLTAPLMPSDHAEHRRIEGRAVLARIAANVNAHHPDVSVTTELSDLSPAHVLEALSRTSSLVVTGTRGRGGFAGMLVGSVTRAVAVHAHCPLIVVPCELPEDVRNAVVLGIGPKHSAAAIRYAFETARSLGGELIVVHAWWPVAAMVGIAAPGGMYVGDPDVFREAAVATAESAIAPARAEFPEVPVRTVVAEGNAVDVLLDAARRSRLLVVGARSQHGPLAVGAGYVVDGVIAHSPVPVVIVPSEVHLR